MEVRVECHSGISPPRVWKEAPESTNASVFYRKGRKEKGREGNVAEREGRNTGEEEKREERKLP